MNLRQVEVIWFSKPHGSPSGVWTGQRKPQDLYSKKRSWKIKGHKNKKKMVKWRGFHKWRETMRKKNILRKQLPHACRAETRKGSTSMNSTKVWKEPQKIQPLCLHCHTCPLKWIRDLTCKFEWVLYYNKLELTNDVFSKKIQ